MVWRLFLCTLLLSFYTFASPSAATTPGFYFAEIESYDLLKTNQQSRVYRANLKGPINYDYPIYLANLKGSRQQMGYDYGLMLGSEINEVYKTFVKKLLTPMGSIFLEPILEAAVDWQWDEFLSKSLPEEYQQELKGIELAGKQLNLPLYRQVTRVILLANAPGDVSDFSLILIREWQNRHALDEKVKDIITRLRLAVHQKDVKGLQCSMFGVWGSRTVNGTLFSARNLDWNKDMGISKYKIITVYNPEDGYPHATAGFVGMWGALAGASSQGLSVHEANLEENEITFNGFPWVLRLRWVMDKANNLATAKEIWESTQNTVGFNHMVTSANDVVNKHAALALETMYNYTAYFLDNDPREAAAKYNTTQIGFPLEEALWRTNHGYDPTIRSHFEWSQSPNSWSMERYQFAYEAFTSYQNSGAKIDTLQAINITSILGDKGKHAYQCFRNTTDGTNVLSVTFQPGASIMNVAWENGTETSWTPAACNIYVQFDLSTFWSKK